ncbi:MAG: ABC transporter permease [Xanthomonadales bacterium]|nr:ABC transporter permease [Xanthomonadales bacterium]
MMASKLLAVTQKDLKLLYRDKGGFFFTFIFPIIMAVFFGSMMSGSGGMKGISLQVVDADQSVISQAFIDKLDAAAELKVVLTDEATARDTVRKGKAAAFLILPKGFGDAKGNLFSGETATVQLGVDPKRSAIKGLLQGVLMSYAAEDMQSAFTDTDKFVDQIDKSLAEVRQARDSGEFADNDKADRMLEFLDQLQEMVDTDSFNNTSSNESADGSTDEDSGFNGFQPLIIETHDISVNRDGPPSGYDVSFPQGILWGILGCLSAFSLSLVSERNQGTLSRLLVSSANRSTILAGKALACFLTIIFIAVCLLLLGKLVFGIQIRQPDLMLLSLVAIGFCFSGLMILFSVISKSEKAAAGITWAAMMLMAMAGGGMIPLAFMPAWMTPVSQFSPVMWSILALEGPMWRQFSLVEMLPVVAVLFGIGIAGFLLGVRLFKWQSSSA